MKLTVSNLIALETHLDRVIPKVQELLAMEPALDRFNTTLENIMATAAEFKATLAEIDAETTRIANAIQVLIDKIAVGGMSADEEAEVQAELTGHLDRLKGIAADPNHPIPE